MTAPSSFVDLDDADAVLAADSHGALRSAALAGAQIRATASAASEGLFSSLDGLRPRSVVLVASTGRAWRAASLVSALVGSAAGVPIVHVTSTPPWVGPLDVVVVAGDDAGDALTVESVSSATRRRAEVVVAAPDEGPLRSAGSGRIVRCPPRMSVLDRNTLSRFVSVMLAVIATVDPAVYDVARLDALADAVDAESMRNHPSMEVFHNPAKAIASRMVGQRVVLAGDSPAATETARHAGEVLLRSGGVPVSAVELADVLAAVHDFGRLGAGGDAPADYDPLFHDDELDGPRPSDPVRVFAISTDADDGAIRRRTSPLGDVDVVRADMGDGSAVEPDAMVGRDPAYGGRPDPRESLPAAIERVLVLAARLEMAAAYVQVTGGG